MQKYDPKFEDMARALLIAMIASLAVTISGRYAILFYPNTAELQAMALGRRFFIGLWGLLAFIVNIVVAMWLYRMAAADDRPKLTWSMLGLFGGLWAPILYFLIPLYAAHARRQVLSDKAENDSDHDRADEAAR